jgi:hypothetical protein
MAGFLDPSTRNDVAEVASGVGRLMTNWLPAPQCSPPVNAQRTLMPVCR